MTTFSKAFFRELSQLKGSGNFATIGSIDYLIPGMFVEGVSEISFPFNQSQANCLIATAHQAPYGNGNEYPYLFWEGNNAEIEFKRQEGKLIGSIPYDSLSQFTDSISNPLQQAWKYRISAVDSCGNESQQSPVHKTLHLNINLGFGGVINLAWDDYFGFIYSTYEVYRFAPSQGWQNIGSVAYTNNSFTDLTPPADAEYYIVEIVPTDPCVATRAVNHNTTRSNKTQSMIGPNSVEQIAELGSASIFPNPTNGNATLLLNLNNSANVHMELLDMNKSVGIHHFHPSVYKVVLQISLCYRLGHILQNRHAI
jgi:hypothetical protein